MLADTICEHPDVQDTSWSKDAELDSAQLLSGHIPFPPISGEQICLQTTYLNECYEEYIQHPDKFRLVWLVRNPNSVIYSMVYNWKRFALNEVFEACGLPYLDAKSRGRYDRFGILGVAPIVRAACAYNGKASQALRLREALSTERMMMVEYENLVRNKPHLMKAIFTFCGLQPDDTAGGKIHTASLSKSKQLSTNETDMVLELCGEWYQRLVELCRA